MNYTIKVETTNLACKRAIIYPEDKAPTSSLILMIIEDLIETQGESFTIITPPWSYEEITLEDGQVIPYEIRHFAENDQVFIYYVKLK